MNSIKMSTNSIANRVSGGRSQGIRHCKNQSGSEKQQMKTFPHVRVKPWSTPKRLRNIVRHKVRTMMADLFYWIRLEVFKDVHYIINFWKAECTFYCINGQPFAFVFRSMKIVLSLRVKTWYSLPSKYNGKYYIRNKFDWKCSVLNVHLTNYCVQKN